jgi:hypothetical protein
MWPGCTRELSQDDRTGTGQGRASSSKAQETRRSWQRRAGRDFLHEEVRLRPVGVGSRFFWWPGVGSWTKEGGPPPPPRVLAFRRSGVQESRGAGVQGRTNATAVEMRSQPLPYGRHNAFSPHSRCRRQTPGAAMIARTEGDCKGKGKGEGEGAVVGHPVLWLGSRQRISYAHQYVAG